MRLPYTVEVRLDAAGYYVGSVKELSGCSTRAGKTESIENLWQLLEEAKFAWITDALERGENIPKPLPISSITEDPERGSEPSDTSSHDLGIEESLHIQGWPDIPHIPDLAQFWLKYLSDTGLHEINADTGAVPKELDSRWPTILTPPKGHVLPVSVGDKGELIWLNLDGPRTDRGYRGIKVFDKPMQTNTAILTMLTVLKVGEINEKKVRKALTSVGPPMYESLIERWWEAWWEEADEQGYEFIDNLQRHYLEFVLALLYYHRPKFDALPYADQVALIEETCKVTNALTSAARRLVYFLEFGAPGKDLRQAVENASRDVKIAVLKDVEGLSDPKIGEMLGIKRSKSYEKKGEHSAVAAAAKRARKTLEDGLGKDGWREWVEAAKAEKSRWEYLTYQEKIMQLYADRLGVSVDEAYYHREKARLRGQRAISISDLEPEDTLDPFYRRDDIEGAI